MENVNDVLTGSKMNKLGYIRHGDVKIVPVKRSSDWLPDNADSLFLNSGATIEYVVPRDGRTGALIDPLGDLTDQEKAKVANELGFKDPNELNIHKQPEKDNFWINRAVAVDRNGLFLKLADVGDFIKFKIMQGNKELIAPSWAERYNKGTYKFAIVFEEEQHQLKLNQIDSKKEAYMLFGKIDGSSRKMTDFLWNYYLTNPKAKRPPNNPSPEFLKSTIGSIVDENPGAFLSIMTDPNFETMTIIQKAMNNGLIHRDGMNYRIFNENLELTSLDQLIHFLKDERNNGIRLSLIGKTEMLEKGPDNKEPIKNTPGDHTANDESENLRNENETLKKRLEALEKAQMPKEKEPEEKVKEDPKPGNDARAEKPAAEKPSEKSAEKQTDKPKAEDKKSSPGKGGKAKGPHNEKKDKPDDDIKGGFDEDIDKL